MSEDEQALQSLNDRFIEAFRQGSWELLEPILSPSFRYLDGTTGEVWPMETYIENLRSNPITELTADEIVVHVAGDVAAVSARTSRQRGRYSRYVDAYERRDGGWACVFACVWPLQA